MFVLSDYWSGGTIIAMVAIWLMGGLRETINRCLLWMFRGAVRYSVRFGARINRCLLRMFRGAVRYVVRVWGRARPSPSRGGIITSPCVPLQIGRAHV